MSRSSSDQASSRGGAILYVVSDEIVPETQAKGNERIAALGTMIGIALMLYLDTTLG